jgi:hypothetical protein
MHETESQKVLEATQSSRAVTTNASKDPSGDAIQLSSESNTLGVS